jgi:hypothetical protein
MPQPTQAARFTCSLAIAYARTSIPISQYVEQFPREMERIYTTAGASGVPDHLVIPSAPVSVMKMTSSWRMPISP